MFDGSRQTARRFRSLVSVVSAALLVVSPNPASAAEFKEKVGSSTARQISGANWQLTLEAGLSNADAARGMCIDSYFDWNVVDARTGVRRHYDVRVVRNCDPGVVVRSKWFDDPTGLVLTGPRKIGSCLVAGTDSKGRWGVRLGCVSLLGASIAPCGSGSAACYIRKNGTTIKTGWLHPQLAHV
jgi:hypothetical protein